MTKPTTAELREMQLDMAVTRVRNWRTSSANWWRKKRRRWPDARDSRISRCVSCGGWQWDQQCPALECWANLEITTNQAA